MPSRNLFGTVATLLLLTVNGPAWAQSKVISQTTLYPTAEDNEARGGTNVDLNFGASVSISGGTAAIGMPHNVEDQYGPGPGRVGIYVKTETGWVRSATLLPSNPGDVRFGRELVLCGDLVVAQADEGTYVFRGHGTHWREIQRIPLSSPDQELGALVCGNHSFAQGVVRFDKLGEKRGTVDVYEYGRGHRFVRVAKLRPSDPNDFVGYYLAIERGILIAGAYPDGAYVFARHGRRWMQRQKLQSFGANGAGINGGVAIRHRIIIAGAPGVEVSTVPTSNAVDGDAFVYLPHRNGWFESQSLNSPLALPDNGSSGYFGVQVAMGDHLAAILAPLTNSDQMYATSAVIVFDRVGAQFTLARAAYAETEDRTLTDIDMSGRRLIVGVNTNRFGLGGKNDGRVTILEFEPLQAPSPAADRDDDDQNESGADEPE